MVQSCPGEPVLKALLLEGVRVGSLDEVSMAVPGGQVVCLSGPSGSGKSRLLRAVADLEPHGGSISLNGTDQLSLPAHQWRRRVVMVPADLNDAAYRWNELKLDGADQGAIRFPLFLQMLCAPMIGFQAPS